MLRSAKVGSQEGQEGYRDESICQQACVISFAVFPSGNYSPGQTANVCQRRWDDIALVRAQPVGGQEVLPMDVERSFFL